MKKKPNTQPPFIIRRARATDLDAIHRLNRELQRYDGHCVLHGFPLAPRLAAMSRNFGE